MQMTVEISTKLYEELRKAPLFFVKFYEDIRTDKNGCERDNSLWKSVNSNYSISFPAQNFGNVVNDYCLCLAESATYVVKQDSHGETYTDKNRVNMVFRNVSNSVQDYRICLIWQKKRQEHRNRKNTSLTYYEKCMEVLTSIHPLYPNHGYDIKNKACQGFYDCVWVTQ